MNYIKKILKKLLPEFELYRVFRVTNQKKVLPTTNNISFKDLSLIDCSNQVLYKETINYNNTESYGFGLFDGDELVAIQWYWFGSQCHKLGWWHTPEDAIMSMHIQVDDRYKGKGLSVLLKGLAISELSTMGFDNIYSRVWHNHFASIAMNKRLGATQLGWQGSIAGKNFIFNTSKEH